MIGREGESCEEERCSRPPPHLHRVVQYGRPVVERQDLEHRGERLEEVVEVGPHTVRLANLSGSSSSQSGSWRQFGAAQGRQGRQEP